MNATRPTAKAGADPAAKRRPPSRLDDEESAEDGADERPASPLQRVADALCAAGRRIKSAFLAKLVFALDVSLVLLRKLRSLAAGPEEADERDNARGGGRARGAVGRRETPTEPPVQAQAPKSRRLRVVLLYALLMSAGAAAGFYVTGNMLVQEAELRPAELESLRSEAAESKKTAAESESEAARHEADTAQYLKRLEEAEAELEKSRTEQDAQADLLAEKDAEIERRKAEIAEQAKLLAAGMRQLTEEQSRRMNAEFRLRSAYPGRAGYSPPDEIARARNEPASRGKASTAPPSGNCAVGAGNVGAALKDCLNTLER